MADDGLNQEKTGYFGQQGLDASSHQFNVLSFIVESFMGRVRTCVMVKVMSVTPGDGDLAMGTVDVMPLVNQTDGVGNSTPHGTIFGMPYMRIQGGTNAVICDPREGDIGFAVIADRDSSAVKSTKAQANPGSKRRFSLADGIYIGGILNGEPEQYVQFTDTGVKVADKNGNVLNMGAGKITATTTLFEIDGALRVTGQTTFADAITGTTATFSGLLTAASATISGALMAASAAITGALSAASAAITNLITGTTVTVTTVNTHEMTVTSHANYTQHQHFVPGVGFSNTPT